MGSPLSSIMTETYLQYFEELLVKHWLESKEIIFYRRYVDDIFIIFDQRRINIDRINNHLNKTITHLDFTYTIEENNTITYLDLNIQRDVQDLSLSIHRKPKQTDTTIHYTSNHPAQHKMAAYKTYIYRMLTLPITKQAQHKEWDIIFSTALNSGYPLSLIHRTRNKIVKKITMQQHKTQTQHKIWSTFTYFSPLIDKVTNFFKHTNISIAFRPTNTILHTLQCHHPNNRLHDSGIYPIQCNNCKRSYVGQYGRSISVRYREHIGCTRTNSPNSAYAQHILNHQHEYGPPEQTLHLLKSCTKGSIMNQWKNFHILQWHDLNQLVQEQQVPDHNPLFRLSTPQPSHRDINTYT